MKNFLSKLWSLSRADRVRTLAIDAMSFPSFCRVNMLKLVSILVILLTLGVGNAWGDDNPVGTFSSDDVVTDNSYTSYSDDNWTLSRGGGGSNHSCGYNNTNSNKTTIGNAYGTSANTSHYGFTIVGKTNISNAYKMTFEYTGGNTYSGGKLYLGYSTNNGSSWSAVPLKSGSGLTGQGGSVGSTNTTYTFEFTAAIASARYAIVLSKNTTSSNGQFRFDHVTAVFYEEGSSCSTNPTVGASSNSSVSLTGATVSCAGITIGDCDIDEWGFYYKTGSGGVTTSDTKVQISDAKSTTSVSSYSKVFTNELTQGTHYYFKPYARVGSDVYLGSETDFTTKALTATRNNSSYGGVPTVSGNVITGSPNSGYIYDSPAYTVTTGNGTTTVEKVGNTFTVSSTSTVDVAIQINYADKGCTDKGASTITSTAGGETYTYSAVSNYYKYGARQLLYTKDDLGLSAATKKGTIKSIYFYYADASNAMTGKDNVTIYMANTYLTALSKENYIPYSAFTQVYTGSLNCSTKNDWNEFILDTPFEYNGAGNLVVIIVDNTGSYAGSSSTMRFKYHDAGSNYQLYQNIDGSTPFDPTDNSIWSAATPTTYRPSTKFCIQEADMEPATVTLMDNSATLTEISVGAGVTLPSRAGCSGYTFAGWTKSWVAEQSSWTTTAPTIIPAGTYHPSSDENLYPVYTKTEGGGSPEFSQYQQVALGGTITAGKYLISTGSYTMAGEGKTGVSLTPGTTEAAAREYTVAIVSGTTITIKGPDNKYIGGLDKADGLTFSTTTPSSDDYRWVYTENGIQNKSITGRHIKAYSTTDFRHYGTGNGTLTYFYRRIETSGSTTSYISVPNCCTPLGTINGSISLTNEGCSAGQLKATWKMNATTGIASQVLHVYDADNDNEVTASKITGITALTSNQTQTITGLTPCHEYYVKVENISTGTGTYCGDGFAGDASSSATTNAWGVTEHLTHTTHTTGAATACPGSNYVATYTVESGYVLPSNITLTIGGVSKTKDTHYTWSVSDDVGTLTILAANITNSAGAIDITVTSTAAAYQFWYGGKGTAWSATAFSDAGSNEWQIANFVMPEYEYDSGLSGSDPDSKQMLWNVSGTGITSTNREFYAIPFAQTQDGCGTWSNYWTGSNKDNWIRGAAAGAKGTLRIYSDQSDNGKLAFIPNEYVLKFGSSEVLFTETSTNVWETAITDLSTLNGGSWTGSTTYRVGVGDASHNWVEVYNKCAATAVSSMGYKTASGNNWATGLNNISSARGKFRIWINNCTNGNWECHFVPYYRVTYDGSGASGSTDPSADVSCEGNDAARTVVAAANGFTVPTGKSFGGWASSPENAAAGVVAYAAGANVVLTSSITLYAIWTDFNYTVTVNQNPSVGATTTGQTTTAHYNGTINLTTTVPSGYRFVNWTTSDGFSITNPTSATTASFTMPNKNVTVTANFVQTHTVTWSVNGATASSVTYDHGAALVLPTPDPSAPSGCSSKTFIGWTTHAEISSEVHDKPTLLNPASPGTVAGDVTYRAVFADEVTGKTTVTRYLYTTSISTGKNYIIASSNSAGSVNTATYPGSGNAFTNTSMTVVSGTPNYIAAPANNNAVWSVATGSASGKYHIQNVGTSGNYIRINGSAANISTDATDVYFDSDHGVFGKSGSGSTSYSFYYSSGWTKGTFSTSNRNYIFEATEVEVETTTTDNYITLCSTCTTPSNVTASSISSTGATISWEGVSIEQQPGGSGTGFVVKYGTNATRDLNSNTVNATSSESSKALTGLTPATQYYAWVQAKCDNSWSETPASFHTAAKITYDKNGGTGTNTSEDVTYNSNVTIKTIATLGFEAPSGKTFNGWLSSSAVTVGGSSTTSVADGATISNLTVAITLTAQWRDLASYTVHYSANNGTIVGGADQIVYENGTLTFPNVTPTCGAFVGWIESSSYSSGTKPSGATFHLAGDEIAVTDALDGKTYYAVYAEETAPEPTEDYVLIENEQNDWSGDYLIVVSYDDSGTPRNRAFDGSLATLDATSNYQDVMITSKTITSNSTTDGYKFTIAKVVGQPGKYSILSAHGEYMGSDASNTASKPNEIDQNSTLTAALYNTISYNSTESRPEILGSHATNPMILTFNKTAGQVRFRYMTSVSTAIQLYKKGGGSTYTYKTSPSCSPTVSTSTPASSFTYVYDNGPSASQTFQVSGSNLSANLNVAAPSNYEVSADNISFSSSINITPTDGRVATTTVYIRLAAGLNVGSYNGGVITVSSTGADDDVSAALTGSVTKAAGAIAFTDFNAVDHYEAEMSKGGTSLDVTLTVSVTGDGAVSYSRSPAAGSSAVPATTPTTTLHVTTVGTWTVTANLAAGTNYTNASTNCQVVVYYADRFYDNLHGNSTIVKRNDTGEDHYTIPSLSDESRLTSGSCSETHYHFMGWVPESALSTLSNDAAYDAVMITGGGTQAASGTNYYAVWAEE